LGREAEETSIAVAFAMMCPTLLLDAREESCVPGDDMVLIALR